MKDSIKIIFKYQNFIYAFIILYFFLNTGIHSDDYNAIQQAKSSKFFDFFNPNPEVRGQNTFGIINHYIFYWSYEVFTNKYEFLYDNYGIFPREENKIQNSQNHCNKLKYFFFCTEN